MIFMNSMDLSMLKFKPGDLLRVKFSMGQIESCLTPSILVLEIRDRLDLLAHVSVPHYVILDRGDVSEISASISHSLMEKIV